MWEFISTQFTILHAWLFQTIIQPALYSLGMMSWDEMAFDGTELFLIGAIELLLLYILFRPLELLAPAENWPDRKQANVDFLYSMLTKLGILPLFFFLALTPAFDWVNGTLRLSGIIPPNLEDFVPILKNSPVLSSVVYLAIFDFNDYWRHRLQHSLNIWWALHSLHHSQRQMSFWTDDREHLLDQLISSLLRATLGLIIGVPPVQFLVVTLISGAIEAFSHANVRLSFGTIGERLIVSPRFHRLHHAMAVGHDGRHRGCNFAQVFSIWDVMFGTANFDATYHPTGITDQLAGIDYGEGFWSQQRLGLTRLWRARGSQL